MRILLTLALSLAPGTLILASRAAAADAGADGTVSTVSTVGTGDTVGTVGTGDTIGTVATVGTGDTVGTVGTVGTEEAGHAAMLLGEWVGNDTASQAIYETVSIEAGTIRWGSPGNPNSGRCETRWRLALTGQGTTFHGQLYAGGEAQRYAVFTLELEPVPCAQGLRYLQFALPTDHPGSGGYAEVVSFSADWSLTGAHNFDRR
jgi:hypothetical protein